MTRAAAIAIVVVGASHGSAWAGGLGVGILSPAIDNTCLDHVGATARHVASAAPGTANGNGAAVPLSGPVDQCGDADLPFELNQCTADLDSSKPLKHLAPETSHP